MKKENIKRLLVVAILTITMVLSFTSCGTQMQTEEEVSKNDDIKYSMFILIEDNNNIGYKIVYHKDTKVMYAISTGYYNAGTFTVMLNADGTPMVYESK